MVRRFYKDVVTLEGLGFYYDFDCRLLNVRLTKIATDKFDEDKVVIVSNVPPEEQDISVILAGEPDHSCFVGNKKDDGFRDYTVPSDLEIWY
jgi:hypothetical protein